MEIPILFLHIGVEPNIFQILLILRSNVKCQVSSDFPGNTGIFQKKKILEIPW